MDGLEFRPAHRQPVKDPGFINHQISMHPLDGHHSQQAVLDIANHMIISGKVTVHIQHVNGIQSDSAWSLHAMIFSSQQCGFLIGPAQQEGKGRRHSDLVLAWPQFRPEVQGDTLTWTWIWKLIVTRHQLSLSGSKGRGTHAGRFIWPPKITNSGIQHDVFSFCFMVSRCQLRNQLLLLLLFRSGAMWMTLCLLSITVHDPVLLIQLHIEPGSRIVEARQGYLIVTRLGNSTLYSVVVLSGYRLRLALLGNVNSIWFVDAAIFLTVLLKIRPLDNPASQAQANTKSQ